jgi:tRNA A-37 threonylcarbamoyl transferase component Bud32
LRSGIVGSRFLIHREVARGRVATLYRGEERSTGRPVAIKLLHQRDSQTEARLVRSFGLHKPIVHPNIVRVRDLIHSERESGLVMDWVQGEQLGRFWLGLPLSRRHGGRPRWACLRPILVGILDALEQLHDRGIVHRDLTPRNVLIRPDWTPVVVDLEIALEESSDVRVTGPNRVLGTPLFVPPEVLQGREPSCRGDLYSVGVMMFQCLTGQPPFKGTSFPEMVLAVQRGRAPSVRSFSPDLPVVVASVIDRLLHRDPERRPGSVRKVREHLGLPQRRPRQPTLASLQDPLPLVGRGPQVGYFRRYAPTWLRRTFHLVKVLGRRGSGKSRLMRAWSTVAANMGLDSQLTCCLPGAARSVLAPLLSGGDPDAIAADVDGLIRARLTPDRPPVALFVDELDIADPQSQTVLRALVRNARGGHLCPLILVVSARDDASISSIAGDAPASTVELRGLSEQAVLQLFERSQRSCRQTQTQARALTLACAGNPEQLRDLLWERCCSGELIRDGAGFRIDDSFVVGLDPRKEEVHRCPVEGVVGWLEQLGQPVEIPLLLASAPADVGSALAAIARGVDAGVFFLKMAGEIPYLAMPGPHPFLVPGEQERRDLHARAARWLTLHLPGAGLGEERIASHWRQADRPDRAAASYRRAAAANAAAGLDSEALRMLRLSGSLERIARRRASATADDGSSTTSDLYELRSMLAAGGGSTDRYRWSGAFKVP